MNIHLMVKKAIAYPLYCCNKIGRTLQKNERNDFLILMYHRIIDKRASETYVQSGMQVDPITFSKQIHYIKENFHVVPLENVSGVHGSKNIMPNRKPVCVLTFDDGWKDFYENAYPVLRSNNVFATVFLPTGIIGTKKRFWTEDLAYVLSGMKRPGKSAGSVESLSDSIGNKIERMEGSIEDRIEKSIEALKILPTEEIDRIIHELAEKWQVDPSVQERSFLSWEEAREMQESGVIFFGSHTKSHRILSAAPENLVRDELIQSKNKLIEEGVVSPSFVPFAYPNGNYTHRIAEMVEKAGYSLALTTEKGWNGVTKNKGELYRLKRIGIHQDVTSTNAMFACRIYGIY